MLLRLVLSSIRYRLGLYIPMLITIVVSLSLLGAAEVVGNSFKEIVDREIGKYGANVIIIPEENQPINEGVPVLVEKIRLREVEVTLAVTTIAELLKMNPAWLVKGNGDILVGKNIAGQMGINKGDFVEIEGSKGEAALLESGTDFDSFIVVNGEVKTPSLVFLKTGEPEKYSGKNAIILKEITKTKYSFLESIKKFMLYIAVISALAAMIVIINLIRIDAGKRMKEFGIFSALGALPQTIARFMLVEFLVLASLSGFLALLVSLVLSWSILLFTANVSPAMNLNAIFYIFITSFVAFVLASLVYLLEFRRYPVIQEMRGE